MIPNSSGSPRRKELLEQMGIKFSVNATNCDESYDPNLVGKEIVEYISKKKANSYQGLNENEILITCDSLVFCSHKNSVLGKPKSKEEYLQMIQLLSNNSHFVYSGVTLKSIDKEITFHDTTSFLSFLFKSFY